MKTDTIGILSSRAIFGKNGVKPSHKAKQWPVRYRPCCIIKYRTPIHIAYLLTRLFFISVFSGISIVLFCSPFSLVVLLRFIPNIL